MSEANKIFHQPVLADKVAELLVTSPRGVYLDSTSGSGGHTEVILNKLDEEGRLLAVDWDPDAVERTKRRISKWESRCRVVCGNFAFLADIVRDQGFSSFDGILFDLGVSSEQIETAERGFSFQKNGPLDMRMNMSNEITAADLVNSLNASELEDLILRFGEERSAGRIARAIVSRRTRGLIMTTTQLAELVCSVYGCRHTRIHPATRTFQALRMAVNNELENISRGLEQAISLLKPGGRLVAISFHSLEDRLVKRIFLRHAGRRESLPQGGSRVVFDPPRLAIITRKPVTPSLSEISGNPRSRSAKMRAAERVGEGECHVEKN